MILLAGLFHGFRGILSIASTLRMFAVGGCDKLLVSWPLFGTFAHGTIPAGQLGTNQRKDDENGEKQQNLPRKIDRRTQWNVVIGAVADNLGVLHSFQCVLLH
jgi:hypothetical protein